MDTHFGSPLFKAIFGRITVSYLAVAVAPLGLGATSAHPAPALSLFETPRDGSAPLLKAIKSAKTSVDVEVYELTDQAIIDALVAAAQKGVRVRVLLNPKSVNGQPNAPAFQYLNSHSATAKYTSPKFTFTLSGSTGVMSAFKS